MRLFVKTLLLLLLWDCAFAAGVWKVSATGAPITWRGGVVQYWTDQGDLSASITVAQADAGLQWACSQWANVPTAALQAVAAGTLAEDVTTANTDVGNGQLVVPPDAQAANGGERLIVIYDRDGSMVDAMRGAGASDVVSCATNAALYWADGYANDGHFAHAVLLLNGNCFVSPNQLQYTLLRATGRLLGVGWSQANDNPSTAADFTGWPVMHAIDGWCMTSCFPDWRLRVDDVASVSRLYPVTQATAVQWPGKTLFRESTGTISGHVLFADGSGMAGVNVVARLVDPVTGARSRSYVVSCVSGYLHAGRPGSGITGWTDSEGVRYDSFGSPDAAMAGYYSLDGLPVPYGASTKYEVTVEPVNALYTGE